MRKHKKNLISPSDLKIIDHWTRDVMTQDKKSKINSFIYTFPHPYLDRGKFRMVFKLNKHYVIKVALKANGIRNNKREIELYQSAKPSIQKHLSKIIDWGYGWIIMKKLDIEVKDSKANKRKLAKVLNKFKNYGIKPNDTKRRNLRLDRKGNLVFVDYGNFKRKSN